jgi:hypothetical protein
MDRQARVKVPNPGDNRPTVGNADVAVRMLAWKRLVPQMDWQDREVAGFRDRGPQCRASSCDRGTP